MKNWIINNWGNLFGILGLIATIYVGVFYVPKHVKESLTEKDRIINIDLIQATKELVYSDSTCTILEIQSLVKGKEVKYSKKYAYSITELLLQTQEAFMEHKFLPLDKRKELVRELEDLKLSATDLSEVINIGKSEIDSISNIKIWGSIIGSIILTFLAAASMFLKFQLEKAKTEEIENQLATMENSIKANKLQGTEYENSLIKIIKDKLGIIGNKEFFSSENSLIDYKFEYKGIKNYVLIKYLQHRKITRAEIQNFLLELKHRKGNAILIYRTGITKMGQNEIDAFKISYPQINLILIHARTVEYFSQMFDEESLKPKA